VKSSEEVMGLKVNTKRTSNVLVLIFVKVEGIKKTSRKTSLRNKVISGQYILKVMKCFELKQ